MKKKYVLLFLCLCFTVVLSAACSKNKETFTLNSSSSKPDIIETGKNHKVIRQVKVVK